ncbi:S-layer homology domain-containing protein, partial [Collinsella tanakaei]|nr:S-layer homology domain-containing protein [Collinsella tanakaei]
MRHKLVCTCRALSVSAALLAALAAPGAAFASTFTDVSSEGWYVDEVAWVADEGIMGGYGDGTFGVGRGLTRAEFAQLLASWAAAPEKGGLEDTTGILDLAEGGRWYTGAANWAVEDKVIMGVDRPDGSVAFEPDMPATREMVVTILWRMATQLGVDTTDDGAALAAMPDANEVSEWAKEAMSWAVDRGIITGVVRDDGSWVEPGRTVLREEIAKIVHVADEVTGGVFEGFAADDFAPVKATIKGIVSLEGRDLAADDFSFELRDADGNAVAMTKNDAKGAFEFNVEVERTGVYRYSVAAIPGDLDGVTYDEKVWSVEVVSSSEGGVLSVSVSYPDGDPKFEMTYEGSSDVPSPGPDPAPDPEPEPEPDPSPDPDNPVTEGGITFEVVEEGDEDAEFGAGAYVTTIEAEDGAVSIPAKLDDAPVVSISLTGQTGITSIDASASGGTLKNLEVTNGELTELDLTGCTELEQLDCSGNVLVGLDIADCMSLDVVDCSNNYLQSITLPGQDAANSVSLLSQTGAELKELDCSHNQIAALDLTGLGNLIRVDCSYNRIEDLSGIQEWALVDGHEAIYEPQFWDSGDKIGLSYELHYCEGGYLEAHVIGYERPEGVEAAGAVVVPGVIEGCPVVSVDAGF